MYKLLIVEDEPIIRAGLKHYFDWEGLGVSALSEAENGKEGIDVALRERPDLIITDIRMPELGGLEMIEKLRGELPDTLFVILTGYNDFNYAQRAIRLGGVHAFLLKPLVFEESLSTLVECINKINIRKEERDKKAGLEKDASAWRSGRGGDLVKRLLEEEDSSVASADIRRLCGFECERYVYQPIVVTRIPEAEGSPFGPPDWHEQAAKKAAEAVKFLHPLATGDSILTYRLKSKLYVLAVLDGSRLPAGTEQTISRPAPDWKRYPEETGDYYLAAGDSTEDFSDAGRLLRLADRALLLRFFKPDSPILAIGGDEADERGRTSGTIAKSAILLTDNEKQEIAACLETGDAVPTKELMCRLAARLSESGPPSSPDEWLSFLQETISCTLRFAHRHGIPVEGVYSDKLHTLACIDDFASFEALFAWLGEWILRLNEAYKEKVDSGSVQDRLIFDKIEAFILKHIDEDITLQVVADRFFYSPSYLSRLFKTKLRKNYMTFVTEIRIRHAQRLLAQPNVLVSDVCSMCGYKSYKHFSKTFKSLTGLSPSDFRNRFRS